MEKYRCSVCGCYLDPGEGQICDDYKEDLRKENAPEQRQLNQGNSRSYSKTNYIVA